MYCRIHEKISGLMIKNWTKEVSLHDAMDEIENLDFEYPLYHSNPPQPPYNIEFGFIDNDDNQIRFGSSGYSWLLEIPIPSKKEILFWDDVSKIQIKWILWDFLSRMDFHQFVYEKFSTNIVHKHKKWKMRTINSKSLWYSLCHNTVEFYHDYDNFIYLHLKEKRKKVPLQDALKYIEENQDKEIEFSNNQNEHILFQKRDKTVYDDKEAWRKYWKIYIPINEKTHCGTDLNNADLILHGTTSTPEIKRIVECFTLDQDDYRRYKYDIYTHNGHSKNLLELYIYKFLHPNPYMKKKITIKNIQNRNMKKREYNLGSFFINYVWLYNQSFKFFTLYFNKGFSSIREMTLNSLRDLYRIEISKSRYVSLKHILRDVENSAFPEGKNNWVKVIVRENGEIYQFRKFGTAMQFEIPMFLFQDTNEILCTNEPNDVYIDDILEWLGQDKNFVENMSKYRSKISVGIGELKYIELSEFDPLDYLDMDLELAQNIRLNNRKWSNEKGRLND